MFAMLNTLVSNVSMLQVEEWWPGLATKQKSGMLLSCLPPTQGGSKDEIRDLLISCHV